MLKPREHDNTNIEAFLTTVRKLRQAAGVVDQPRPESQREMVRKRCKEHIDQRVENAASAISLLNNSYRPPSITLGELNAFLEEHSAEQRRLRIERDQEFDRRVHRILFGAVHTPGPVIRVISVD